MPSIADIYVTLLPETSKISAGITAAFRRVDPEAREAGRRWGREIQAGLGEAKVELTADTAKAQAQIDEAAKDKKATVEVDADTAKAEAQIDVAARDRKATIEVDADTLVSSAERSFSQLGPAFAGAGTQLSTSLASGGASGASSAGGSLSAAMGPVGTALTVALVGGAVTAAAGVAAALTGALGLIPAGLGGGIGVIGTLVTGLDGVKDAWDAAGKAADSATKDQAAKAKEVASAQKSLRDAVMDEATAQKDVANARKDARIQLEDLNVQLRGGVIDEKSAILDAQAARRDLATGRFKDSIEYQQAQLRVQQADQRVLEAHERNVDLQNKATDANAKGVDQSDQVVSANQRLAKAHDNVADAQRNLADAQKPSSNQESLIESMAKLSPVAQGFVNTLVGLKPAWQALKFTVQDTLFAGIGPQIQALTTQYLPVLKTALGGLAGTMNTAFKDVAAWLSKPETMATIQSIVSNIGASFQQWAQSIVPFSQAFLTITQVGSGFLPGLGKMIADAGTAFNNFITQASQSGELQNWIRTGIEAVSQLLKMMPILGKMFLDLAPMAIPFLQMMNSLLPVIEPIFRGLGIVAERFFTGFNKFINTAKGWIDGFVGTIKSLGDVFSRVWQSISGAIDKAWKVIKPILDMFKDALSKLDPGHILEKLGGLASKLFGDNTVSGTPTAAPSSAGGAPAASATGPLQGAAGGASAGVGASAAPSGFDWDAVAKAEASGNWADRDSGHNGHYGGLQFSLGTWTDYGGVGNPADASPEMQKMIADRVAFTGWNGKPPQGLGAWETVTKGMVPGVTTGSTPSSMPSAGAGSASSMPSLGAGASALPPGWHPNASSAAPSGLTTGGGDAGLLAGVPAGTYLQTQAADLTKGIGDCSSAVEDLINMMDGVSTAGRGMSTSNAPQWLTAHGFLPGTGGPGDFRVGFNSQHMQATLPGGTPFNWGSDAAAANRGIGGTGAFDPAFTSHYYRPGGVPNIGGMYPSAAGMPTIASPQGVSPSGVPLGTQQSPMYVQNAQSGSGQQLGQDMVSGIAEMFGFDGSLFKNPMDSGLFKGFKGLMGFLTGGGKGGQGLPASAWAAQGGDGAALPMGGGGDLFGGLGGMLQGIMPQPFGQTTRGGPGQAPSDYQPMLPGSGGISSLNFTTPRGNGEVTSAGHNFDQSINFFGPVGNPQAAGDMATGLNVPRARQGVQSIPGMP